MIIKRISFVTHEHERRTPGTRGGRERSGSPAVSDEKEKQLPLAAAAVSHAVVYIV